MYKGLMLTDLDGTFLNPVGKINQANLDALELLHQNGIARAVCTGRTLDSSREVVPRNLPFDYLIFSSGAGICKFANEEILCRHELSHNDILVLTDYFRDKQVDFSVHFPIPDNHFFYWFSGPTKSLDLISRLHWLKDFAIEGNEELINNLKSATQLLAIVKDEQLYMLDELRESYKHLSFIRATSPLNQGYTWIEVFPKDVSKGKGAEWLCNYLNIPWENTVSLGNDYNDIHMLEWTATSYIMENSPEDLKKRFRVTLSNADDGFAAAIKQWLLPPFVKGD